jgi:hypothetical protein
MIGSWLRYTLQRRWIRTPTIFSSGRKTLSEYRFTYKRIHTVPTQPLHSDQQVRSNEGRKWTAGYIMVVTRRVWGRGEVGTESDIYKLVKSHHLTHDRPAPHFGISFLLFNASSWRWEVKTIVSFNLHSPDPQPPDTKHKSYNRGYLALQQRYPNCHFNGAIVDGNFCSLICPTLLQN